MSSFNIYCRSKNPMRRPSAVVITTVQLDSSKFELRFCSGTEPTCSVSEIWVGEKFLTMVLAGKKA